MKFYSKILHIAFFLGFLLLIATAIYGQNDRSAEIEQLIAGTDSLIEKRDFQSALNKLYSFNTRDFHNENKAAIYFQFQKIYAPSFLGNLDSAIFYTQQILPLLEKDSAIITELKKIGDFQVFQSNFPEAEKTFQKVLTGIEHLPTSLDSIKLFSRLSLIYGELEQRDQQLYYLEKVNEVAQNSTDNFARTIAYLDQLNYYYSKSDRDKMKELLPYFKDAGFKNSDSLWLCITAKSVSGFHSQLLELDSAEYYTLRAIDYLNSKSPPIEEYFLHINLANIYRQKKEFDKAIYVGKKGINGLQKGGYGQTRNMRYAYGVMAWTFEESGKLREAELYFRKELALSRKQEKAQNIEAALTSLIRVLKASGKTNEVIPYYEERLTLKDSIHAQFNKQQIAEAETRLGLTLKEQEFETQNLRIEQQQQKQAGYIILIALLLAILVGGYWAFRRINRDKKLITHQKTQVEQSLNEKEVLLKEIHHRVKNNLQIISSLLDKQARSSSDQTLKNKMQEGKDRIHSMALIHQNLYQSENLSSIEIKKYIQELASNISFTQKSEDQDIEIIINAEDIRLNIDQAIPLGLILNELLTNTFKHGLKNKSKGLIDITLKKQGAKQFELSVKDNGWGLKPNFELNQTNTLGMNLVVGLVQQLDGNLTYDSSKLGTNFTIQF